jgi:hypothetical protein
LLVVEKEPSLLAEEDDDCLLEAVASTSSPISGLDLDRFLLL